MGIDRVRSLPSSWELVDWKKAHEALSFSKEKVSSRNDIKARTVRSGKRFHINLFMSLSRWIFGSCLVDRFSGFVITPGKGWKLSIELEGWIWKVKNWIKNLFKHSGSSGSIIVQQKSSITLKGLWSNIFCVISVKNNKMLNAIF